MLLNKFIKLYMFCVSAAVACFMLLVSSIASQLFWDQDCGPGSADQMLQLSTVWFGRATEADQGVQGC